MWLSAEGARSHQKLGEAKEDSLLESLEGANPTDTLILDIGLLELWEHKFLFEATKFVTMFMAALASQYMLPSFWLAVYIWSPEIKAGRSSCYTYISKHWLCEGTW